MKPKIVFLSISVLLIILISSGLYIANRTKTQIKELFRMNKELQEEGYYMAEFEFKMLGLTYYLNKGDYYTALIRIDQLHHQLKTKQGLTKLPKFKEKEEELQFYLNLQNPNTGAFMDDSFPYCTYTGPTGNVLEHLDVLCTELGQPLKLKYPLKYLDRINTPETIRAYLNDVSTVRWIASRFPQTTFHNARDVLSLYYEDNTVEKHHLYHIAPEVKKALLQWFYDHQDPVTGLWGPKSKSGKLMKKDVMNSVSILKVFINQERRNPTDSLKLKYKDELSKTIIKELFEPTPGNDELDEWHEWNLKTSKSLNALLNYLWNDISKENKEKTKDFIAHYIMMKFEKFYVPKEGAFSYYPYGTHATIDGTGDFFIFEKIGAFSEAKQKQLWRTSKDNIVNLTTKKIAGLKKSDFDLIANAKAINSLRIYKTEPDYENLTSNVFAVIYPKKPLGLDVMDVTPKVKHWLKTTDQTMGNWTSKEKLIRILESIKLKEVPVYANEIPIASVKEILRKQGKLVVIGFDILQAPRYQIIYELEKKI